jgi:Zn-dependent protease
MTTSVSCRNCGQPLQAVELVCPSCHALVHKDRLEYLAGLAASQESSDPAAAVATWRESLALLPAESRQHQVISRRIENLLAGSSSSIPVAQASAPRVLQYRPVEATGRQDSWGSILLKTGGSMLLSIGLFYMFGGLLFAVGIVGLILVHEMGHVVANWYYGLRSSPPIFLGFLGAVIYLKDPPPNAKVEAIVGIAGPIAGTAAALVVYLIYLQTGDPLIMHLAGIGFWINLFNLIPVPPLDGGRVAAAISPKLWPLGVIGMLALFGYRAMQNRISDVSIYLVIWLLLSALPRIRYTLSSGVLKSPYFKVEPAARAALTVTYFGLAIVLYLLESSTRQ